MLEHREVSMNIVSDDQKYSICRHNGQVKLSYNWNTTQNTQKSIISSFLFETIIIRNTHFETSDGGSERSSRARSGSSMARKSSKQEQEQEQEYGEGRA